MVKDIVQYSTVQYSINVIEFSLCNVVLVVVVVPCITNACDPPLFFSLSLPSL